MSVFAYDPDAAKTWSTSVVGYINGGDESIDACCKKFGQQLEKLVQTDVWTGTAARQNYQNFLETHTALVNFSNNFGNAFQSAMNSVNQSVGSLEEANLGSSSSVSSFGTLDFSQLQALSEQSINTDVVRYNYTVIADIGSNLADIMKSLETVEVGLTRKIDELNNGSAIWDGNAAEEAKGDLKKTLTENMQTVKNALNICISNISAAAEAAQAADRG